MPTITIANVSLIEKHFWSRVIGPIFLFHHFVKLKKIYEHSLDLIPSPSPSVKSQIFGIKVYHRWWGKTWLGDINKLFVFKSLLTRPRNVLSLHLKQTFPPIIWTFIEGDGINFRLAFKIFSTFNEGIKMNPKKLSHASTTIRIVILKIEQIVLIWSSSRSWNF